MVSEEIIYDQYTYISPIYEDLPGNGNFTQPIFDIYNVTHYCGYEEIPFMEEVDDKKGHFPGCPVENSWILSNSDSRPGNCSFKNQRH